MADDNKAPTALNGPATTSQSPAPATASAAPKKLGRNSFQVKDEDGVNRSYKTNPSWYESATETLGHDRTHVNAVAAARAKTKGE